MSSQNGPNSHAEAVRLAEESKRAGVHLNTSQWNPLSRTTYSKNGGK